MVVVEVGGAGLWWWVKVVVDSGGWCWWCWMVVVGNDGVVLDGGYKVLVVSCG